MMKQTNESPERSQIITNWYLSAFPVVAAYVQRNGGCLEEAKEVFQEAMVTYYEKIALQGFVPEKDDKSYLLGIAKYKWLKAANSRNRWDSLDQQDFPEESEAVPQTDKLLHYLRKTGEKCLQVLQAFYYERLSMAQLADRFGFKSERSATVQKYKCLEKVREQVKSKSLNYEDFVS